MDWIINVPRRIKRFFKNLPNKKHHLDFFVAILSIPVLLTVIITNILNLQSKNKENVPTPTPVQRIIEKPIIIEKNTDSNNQDATATIIEGCIKEVGPINITSPLEGEIIKDNPVCITIEYEDSDYCSVVWSYRINDGSWSDYNSNSVCLYAVPKGKVKFDLKAQSTVSQDQTSLSRNFNYQGTATSSAQGD